MLFTNTFIKHFKVKSKYIKFIQIVFLKKIIINRFVYPESSFLNNYAPIMYKIAHVLVYINSSINPLIYNFMSENFSKEFKRIIFCRQNVKVLANNNTDVSMRFTSRNPSVAMDRTTINTTYNFKTGNRNFSKSTNSFQTKSQYVDGQYTTETENLFTNKPSNV